MRSMHMFRLSILGLLTLGYAAQAVPPAAPAPSPAPAPVTPAPAPVAPAPAPANRPLPHIAIANPAFIFAKMRETAAMKEKLKDRQNALSGKGQQLQDEIRDLIKDRDQYKPESPKYVEVSELIDQKKSAYQGWLGSTKASIERQEKMMAREFYNKIEAAVSQVAQQNNIDLVIADSRRELNNLEDISPDELQRLLNTRAILYSNKTVDISELVIAVLDKQFADGGGNVVPPPLPK